MTTTTAPPTATDLAELLAAADAAHHACDAAYLIANSALICRAEAAFREAVRAYLDASQGRSWPGEEASDGRD